MMHLQLTILFLPQKRHRIYPGLMAFVTDIEQTALMIFMIFIEKVAVRALAKKLKEELCLAHLYFHQDIMMRIIKKRCKLEAL